jgi:DNA-binding MarR family transcriptional regulator
MQVRTRQKKSAAEPRAVDTTYLQTLIGYNCRRAAVSVISLFLERMAVYGLKPVDFSVLSLILHNPGVTSRQLCSALDLLPPSLVGIVNTLDQRGFLTRSTISTDRRAIGLSLSPEGERFMADCEAEVTQLELDASKRLTPGQRKTLIKLLQRIYLDH